MTNGSTLIPVEVNERFLRARAAITAALEALDRADGMGSAEQYQAVVVARRRAASVYRDARAISYGSELDETLWFALDDAALWQDREADRYRRLAAGPEPRQPRSDPQGSP
jgi:hypothetical protein